MNIAAFPNSVKPVGERAGMTLRDYIASHVVVAVIAVTEIHTDGDWDGIVAQRAYEIADAMLKARERTTSV